MAAKKAKKATPKKRGPKEERLKLEGPWEKSVGDALKTKPRAGRNG